MSVLSKLSPYLNTSEFISKNYWSYFLKLDSRKVLNQHGAMVFSFIGTCWLIKSLWSIFIVPKELSHIPKVNTFSWFWSVVIGESYDVRMKRLMVPIMNKHGLCLKYIMGKWVIAVGDPVLLQTLLKDVDIYPKEKVAISPDLILTNQEPNIGNANYKDWRRQRGVTNPVFHRPMPVQVFGEIVKKMFNTMNTFHPDGKVDVADYMRRYALDCLGLGIFNFDMEAITDRNSRYVALYKEAFSIVRDPWVYLFPAYTRIPSKYIPYRNRARKANESLRKILSDIITDRKQDIKNGCFKDPENPKVPDLLSMMIMSAEECHGGDSSYLTDGELVSNLALFFVAGHETTASATASFMYYLAVDQTIQDKARAEVLSVLGDSAEEIIPTDGELKQMKYLDYCIKETMRINPPTSGNLPRIVTKDTYLGEFFVPKDTRVTIELYGVHQLSKYWDQPEIFNPNRFDKKDKSYRENAIWMPFGYGPRTCIGLNFSITEQRVLQAMILKKYTWCLVPNSEHENGIMNAKGGGIGLLGPENLTLQLTKRY